MPIRVTLRATKGLSPTLGALGFVRQCLHRDRRTRRRAWALIMLGEEAADGDLQVREGAEDAVFQLPAGELCKESLDGVGSRAGRWRKMKRPARMPRQSGADFVVLVGGIIVEVT